MITLHITDAQFDALKKEYPLVFGFLKSLEFDEEEEMTKTLADWVAKRNNCDLTTDTLEGVEWGLLQFAREVYRYHEIPLVPCESWRVTGLNIRHYLGEVTVGHNCAFEDIPAVLTQYTLYFSNEKGQKKKLTLSESTGQCGSGWTTASWGRFDWEYIYSPEPFSHIPVEKLEVMLPKNPNGLDFYENHLFSYSYDGGDSYYPSGGVNVSTELFKETERYNPKPLVYLIHGNSGFGKTTMAQSIVKSLPSGANGFYDTDCSRKLPKTLNHNVVVIGNKSVFSLFGVKRCYGDLASKVEFVEVTLTL